MDGFLIQKIDASQHLVFGYANVAVTNEGKWIEDLQEDSIPPAELEKAAYEFVLKSRAADAMHEGPVVGHVVESLVFTPDKLVKFATKPDGTVDDAAHEVLKRLFQSRWWVGFHVPDEDVFKKVQDGTYKMFSIAGEAEREKSA